MTLKLNSFFLWGYIPENRNAPLSQVKFSDAWIKHRELTSSSIAA